MKIHVPHKCEMTLNVWVGLVVDNARIGVIIILHHYISFDVVQLWVYEVYHLTRIKPLIHCTFKKSLDIDFYGAEISE